MRRTRLSPSIFSRKSRKLEKRSRRVARRAQLSVESLETRDMLSVSTFQQGVGGYSRTNAFVLCPISPTVNFSTDTSISIDQQDLNGERQGLPKFDGIFGPNPGQIPQGSTINSASLTLSIFNESNSSALISLYRMKQNWNQDSATW